MISAELSHQSKDVSKEVLKEVNTNAPTVNPEVNKNSLLLNFFMDDIFLKDNDKKKILVNKDTIV